jgi:hypothetical protein
LPRRNHPVLGILPYRAVLVAVLKIVAALLFVVPGSPR